MEHRTSDLYYAAYLQVSGCEMTRTHRVEASGKVSFVFDVEPTTLDDLKTSWFNSTGKVSGNQYAHCVKNLKSLCHVK